MVEVRLASASDDTGPQHDLVHDRVPGRVRQSTVAHWLPRPVLGVRTLSISCAPIQKTLTRGMVLQASHPAEQVPSRTFFAAMGV